MSSSTKNTNTAGGDGQIQTYNIMGGGLEGFAIPVGLLRMSEASQLSGGGSGGGVVNDFSKIRIPDFTNVDAISHDLYEKLFKLSQYDNTQVATKKNKKTRKISPLSISRKSKKMKR